MIFNDIITVIIPTHSLSWLFPVTYLGAVMIIAGAFILQGIREHYPFPKVILTLSACILFFILGSKLATYDHEGWTYFYQHLRLPLTSQKSMLTGYPLLFAGIILAAHWMKFNPLRLDKSALVVPIGLAIQQFGCLGAGCCGGYECHLPWAIQYDHGSIISQVQSANGHHFFNLDPSLPVHPAPVYMILLLMLSFFILLKTYKKFKTPGTIRFLAYFLLIISRFIVEFFRDPSTDHIGGEIVFGLKKMQWALLLVIFIIGLFIYCWEKVWAHSPWKTRSYDPDNKRTTSFLLFLYILYFYGLPSFDPAEKIVIQTFLAGSLVVVVVLLIRQFRHFGQRSLAFMLALAGLFSLGQSYRTSDMKQGVYVDWNATSSFGHYYNNVKKIVSVQSTGCGGNLYSYKQYTSKKNYSQGVIGVSIINVNSRQKKSVFDFAVSAGKEKDHFLDTNVSAESSILRFSTAYTYESQKASVMVGLHAGNFYFSNFGQVTETDWDLNGYQQKYSIFPVLGLRFGNPRSVFFRASLGNDPIVLTPLQMYSFGVGFGLGKPNTPVFELGMSGEAFYLRSEWTLYSNLRMQAGFINGLSSKYDNVSGLNIGLSYYSPEGKQQEKK